MIIRTLFLAGSLLLGPLLMYTGAASPPPGSDTGGFPTLDRATASRFARMALDCIGREYPNKPSTVMNSAKDVQSPQSLHPAFYGCFDWHSAVHGHWLLIRLLRLFPDLPEGPEIRAALDRNLTADHLRREAEFFTAPHRETFERTYGWAWLLKLAEELDRWDDPQGRTWRENLRPLEEMIVARYLDFLPKQTYPIRTGLHPNTAFGMAFALDYARATGHQKLESLIVSRSMAYYAADVACPGSWEPGGNDFLSPCLTEAWLMQRVLDPTRFEGWFHSFLPGIKNHQPESLLTPAVVTDRSDGQLVHLDGLNLSRAWCMRRIAAALPQGDPDKTILMTAATIHARDALVNIRSGDYAGEHWLATFAVYLLSEQGIGSRVDGNTATGK